MKHYQTAAIISVLENKLFCETFFKSSDAAVVGAVDDICSGLACFWALLVLESLSRDNIGCKLQDLMSFCIYSVYKYLYTVPFELLSRDMLTCLCFLIFYVIAGAAQGIPLELVFL